MSRTSDDPFDGGIHDGGKAQRISPFEQRQHVQERPEDGSRPEGPPFNPLKLAEALQVQVVANANVADARVIFSEAGPRIEVRRVRYEETSDLRYETVTILPNRAVLPVTIRDEPPEQVAGVG